MFNILCRHLLVCPIKWNNIQIFYFNGMNVANHWHVAGRGICHLWLPCLEMDCYFESAIFTNMRYGAIIDSQINAYIRYRFNKETNPICSCLLCDLNDAIYLVPCIFLLSSMLICKSSDISHIHVNLHGGNILVCIALFVYSGQRPTTFNYIMLYMYTYW